MERDTAHPQSSRTRLIAITASLALNVFLSVLFFAQDVQKRGLKARLANQATQIAQRDFDDRNLKARLSTIEASLQRLKANLAAIRTPAGVIATVAGNECSVDVGSGDVSVGMTFEIYDRSTGIPALGSIPAGKGSIEVIRAAGDHATRCRIVHLEPGQVIGPGDLVANVVYNQNKKKNSFFVHGQFDLYNGRSTLRGNDGELVRRLIQQFGGKVQPIADAANVADSLTPDTQFVVIGREPLVPVFTEAERQDPLIQQVLDKATVRLATYQSVVAKATEYGVPVLNQDAFMHYTGYADQLRR